MKSLGNKFCIDEIFNKGIRVREIFYCDKQNLFFYNRKKTQQPIREGYFFDEYSHACWGAKFLAKKKIDSYKIKIEVYNKYL